MATTMITDGVYTQADLIALKSRRPAFYATVPADEQERMTAELHEIARTALEGLEEHQTSSGTDAELAVRIVGGDVVEIVEAE